MKYTVTREVTLVWKVEASDKETAMEIVLDKGEMTAVIINGDFKVKKIKLGEGNE